MRSLMFLLVLVLFCSVPMTSSATNAIEAGQSKCCMEFSKVKIPVKLVKSYYWTSSSCARRAIVFQTIAGRKFCVDPETTWVNGHVDKVNKRTTSATTTTTTKTSSASTATAKTQSPTV
ncbi:hypothetical protein R3I93_022689 [Phoxinus phoxinus]|uniref:Chemokine interleukin-8-like domain-containing protein n=1 Tax=Phoxinus phoxinus TaxID=58324 RepID=A0AAN9C6D8_9TELE